MAKYHINAAGEVKPCQANKRACRYGEEVHFATQEEAQAQSEKLLSASHSPLQSRRREDPAASERQRVFRERLTTLLQDPSTGVKALTEVGRLVEEELQARLPFNMDEDDLTLEQYKEIEKANRTLLSELTPTGAPLPNVIHGTQAKNLQTAVSFLPNSIKNFHREPLITKTVRSDNAQHWGRYEGLGSMEVTMMAKSESNELDDETYAHVPDGVLYKSSAFLESDLHEPHFSFRASIRMRGAKEVQDVWVGTPRDGRAKKLSDSCQIEHRGRIITVQKPVYALRDRKTLYGPVIKAVKGEGAPESFQRNQSILLHEYVHFIQDKTHALPFSDTDLYFPMSREEPPTKTSQNKSAFPHDYMNTTGGLEFITVASEGLFYSGAGQRNTFLYGQAKGNNAARVRQWTWGYWLKLDHYLKAREASDERRAAGS